jgi:hypothetical protein
MFALFGCYGRGSCCNRSDGQVGFRNCVNDCDVPDSQVSDRPSRHGTRVRPSGLLPSVRARSPGSLVAGTPARSNERQIRSIYYYYYLVAIGTSFPVIIIIITSNAKMPAYCWSIISAYHGGSGSSRSTNIVTNLANAAISRATFRTLHGGLTFRIW